MSRSNPRIRVVENCLPQTQCGRCGYPRCIDYAEALLENQTEINRCPPGGETTIRMLARELNREVTSIDPSCGDYQGRFLAEIIEEQCIGCTLCIQACPVDAIIGSGKLMHTVINDECTGCELCLPPCPVDCIRLRPVVGIESDSPWVEFSLQQVRKARLRSWQKTARERQAEIRQDRYQDVSENTKIPDSLMIKSEILAAVKRQKSIKNDTES